MRTNTLRKCSKCRFASRRAFVGRAYVNGDRPAQLRILRLIAVALAGVAVHLQVARDHLHRAEGLQIGVAPVGVRRPSRWFPFEPCDGIQIGGCGFWYGRGQRFTYCDVVVPALERERARARSTRSTIRSCASWKRSCEKVGLTPKVWYSAPMPRTKPLISRPPLMHVDHRVLFGHGERVGP